MALCTQADVEKRLQWDITAEPDPVVTMLIADAQAMIEAEIGRTVETASRNQTFDGWVGWSVFLKHWPVTAVATVTEDGTALTVNTEYKFYPNGKLIRLAGGYQTYWRTTEPQSIVVAYTGGYVAPAYSMELEHLGSICAEVVARALRRGADNAAVPAGAAGAIQSVSLSGSDTVSYATGGSTGTIGGGVSQFVYLEEDEIRQLHLPRYIRPRMGFA